MIKSNKFYYSKSSYIQPIISKFIGILQKKPRNEHKSLLQSFYAHVFERFVYEIRLKTVVFHVAMKYISSSFYITKTLLTLIYIAINVCPNDFIEIYSVVTPHVTAWNTLRL